MELLIERYENFYFHFFSGGYFQPYLEYRKCNPSCDYMIPSFTTNSLETVMRNNDWFCFLLLWICFSRLCGNFENKVFAIFLYIPPNHLSLCFQRSAVCKIKEELNEVICGKVIRLWMIIVFLVLLIVGVIILSLFLCTGKVLWDILRHV